MAAETSLAISPFIEGDPVWLGSEVTLPADIATRLSLPADAAWGCVQIAPAVVLIHSLTRDTGGVVLRWVNLPHRPQSHRTCHPRTPPWCSSRR
jgi:hypothetical protein